MGFLISLGLSVIGLVVGIYVVLVIAAAVMATPIVVFAGLSKLATALPLKPAPKAPRPKGDLRNLIIAACVTVFTVPVVGYILIMIGGR
jgi:hypothetical protein